MASSENRKLIESLKLEVVRPGPRHGMLVSPLIPYVSLCEGVEADTVRAPFEHIELQENLQALRYYVDGGEGAERVPNVQRAAAVTRLSNSVRDILEQMRGFQTRIAEVGAEAKLTNVRLVLGGSELALVPFELATAPSGWRAAGGKLMLQTRAPTVMTRELRHSERIPLCWNRPPRILLCSARPAGLDPPPLKSHLVAILKALRPWLDGAPAGQQRDDIVSVLPDASLEAIAEKLNSVKDSMQYTHVHFVCHGARIPGKQERYGLALCNAHDPSKEERASAEQLAEVLAGPAETRSPPTMVVLASCDSAQQGNVAAPGASLAHELHESGIPWVIASQLPLTYGGSTIFARVFYDGIFRGQDPRWVLRDVRAALGRHAESGHDWASLVAYATFSPDFEDQQRDFRIAQMSRFIKSALQRIHREGRSGAPASVTPGESATRDSWQEEYDRVQGYLADWKRAIPSGDRFEPLLAEHLGIRGSVEKQFADKAVSANESKREGLWRRASEHFLAAARLQVGNHWVAVQHAFLQYLLGREMPAAWLRVAEHAAGLEWDQKKERWAAGSLLEIAVLTGDTARGMDHRQWATELAERCGTESDFVQSTIRQLERYAPLSDPLSIRKDSEGVLRRSREAAAVLKPRV